MKPKKRIKKKQPTDFYDLATAGISQSAMKTFMSCRRKWMLGIAGLSRKGVQINTHFGSIVHEMLDEVYQHITELDPEDIMQFVTEKLEKYLEEKDDEIYITSEQNAMEKEMAIAIVDGYFRFFHKDSSNFSDMVPEYEFAIPYKGVTLRGKVDGVTRIRRKGLWQIEHKTKSRVDEEGILKALQFDFQNLMYSFVLDRENPEPIKGILYNIIRKPGLRQGKKETAPEFLARVKEDIEKRPEWYYMRYEVVYSDKDKRNFKEQLDGIIGEMKMFIAGDLPDLQNQAHCMAPFKCEFLNVCSAGSTEGLVLRDTIHAELDADIKPSVHLLKHYGLKI